MLARVARLLVLRFAGSPARAALYLSGFTALRRVLGAKPVVESVRVRPGERFVIEHLDVSHARQIKQLKHEEKQARRARRAARKAGRRTAS
jgi:hypothetical protein